jgi:hypothetical protein
MDRGALFKFPKQSAIINKWVSNKKSIKWIAVLFDCQQEMAANKTIDSPVKLGEHAGCTLNVQIVKTLGRGVDNE